MELKALQNLFYDALSEKDASNPEELEQRIKAAQNLTPAQGLAVYRGSVTGKLSQTLRSIYPVCYRLVGKNFFEATALTYIRQFPSLSPDLGDYGGQFPDFLKEFEPAAKLPYLPDVACLEWYWHRVFNGEDATGLDFQALSKVPQERWGEIIFHLPENSVLIESAYPIHRIWQVNQPEWKGEGQVNLEEGGVKIFLWRDGYEMRIDLPTEEEWQLLKAIRAKKRFEKVCEDLAAEEPAIDVAPLLPLLVQRGWIAGFFL
ncbi:MAG: DUF2063 domain-containing protein [Symploca sp. SIO2C1]|nr:DUF2063 domain-containing protein [Symploca sp. SIO2C1]